MITIYKIIQYGRFHALKIQLGDFRTIWFVTFQVETFNLPIWTIREKTEPKSTHSWTNGSKLPHLDYIKEQTWVKKLLQGVSCCDFSIPDEKLLRPRKSERPASLILFHAYNRTQIRWWKTYCKSKKKLWMQYQAFFLRKWLILKEKLVDNQPFITKTKSLFKYEFRRLHKK